MKESEYRCRRRRGEICKKTKVLGKRSRGLSGPPNSKSVTYFSFVIQSRLTIKRQDFCHAFRALLNDRNSPTEACVWRIAPLRREMLVLSPGTRFFSRWGMTAIQIINQSQDLRNEHGAYHLQQCDPIDFPCRFDIGQEPQGKQTREADRSQ